MDRSAEDVLGLCEARGIAFLLWFPLANGELRGRGQLAPAWLLHRSPVLCPTPGTGSLVHLEENMDAAALRLSAEEMAEL